MATGNIDKRPNQMGRRCVLVLVACIVCLSGCDALDLLSLPSEPPVPALDERSDLGAIATVVEHVYSNWVGGVPVLFLSAGGTCDSMFPSCNPPVGGISPVLKAYLEKNLQVKVRPRSEAVLSGYMDDLSAPDFLPEFTLLDPDTGEVGVEVSLGRFSVVREGRLRVSVFVSHSGMSCAGFDVDLEQTDDGWEIVIPDGPPTPILIC